jgi:antitoxin (DNA-binding transcriptional repressor) of toxin-antitoxin stability system
MKTYELDTLPSPLQTLVEQAQSGEEILLTEHDQPVAKLVSVTPSVPAHPKAGTLAGGLWMADDFNAPLADFQDYQQ